MTIKPDFDNGIFFSKEEYDAEYVLRYINGKACLQIFQNGQCIKDRRWSMPPWRSKRLAKDFFELLIDHGFTTDNLEQEILLAEMKYEAWAKSRPEPFDVVEEKESIQTSCLIKDRMYEEIIKNGQPMFVYYNNTKLHFTPHLSLDGVEYVPILDDAVHQQAVLLPTDVLDYESPEKLVDEIKLHIGFYLDISDSFLTFASYYVLLSWIYEKLDTVPYLRALGDTGTGKSRFLRVLGGLCYKPTFVAGSITPAPIYRLIKRWGGTIVLDEADFRDSSEKNEVITILNCGFSRGTPVIRCEKDDPDSIQILPTFSPKVIATRYSFQDKALESRCLTENMKQTTRRDIPRILPKEFYEQEMILRNKLLNFRLTFYDKIDTSVIKEIDLGNIEPRLEQATVSFAILFYKTGGLFEQFKNFLSKYQVELVEERSESYDGVIVATYINLLESGQEVISANDIVKVMKESGWDKITAQGVGKHLKSLGLERREMRDSENKKKRGIVRPNDSMLETLKNRYILSENLSHVSSVSSYMREGLLNSVCDKEDSHTEKTPPEPHIFETLATNETLETKNKNNPDSPDEPRIGWGMCPNCRRSQKYNNTYGCVSCGYHPRGQAGREQDFD